MLLFLTENVGTIVVGFIVVGIIVAIIIKMIHDKQKGKCAGCDLNCADCSSANGSTE